MESRPVVGLIVSPKSSSRLRELVSPQPLPWVHSSPRWIGADTVRMAKLLPPLVERATCTSQAALPFALGLPITFALLLPPARLVPYHATSTRPARPPATVG